MSNGNFGWTQALPALVRTARVRVPVKAGSGTITYVTQRYWAGTKKNLAFVALIVGLYMFGSVQAMESGNVGLAVMRILLGMMFAFAMWIAKSKMDFVSLYENAAYTTLLLGNQYLAYGYAAQMSATELIACLKATREAPEVVSDTTGIAQEIDMMVWSLETIETHQWGKHKGEPVVTALPADLQGAVADEADTRDAAAGLLIRVWTLTSNSNA